MDLNTLIREEIKKQPGQAIPFSRYMELALYHPSYGYYMSDKPKVGKEGDFYTSASVHPVFAETLADAVIHMWQASNITAPTLVEIGGGTGSQCRHMLDRIRDIVPELYETLTVMMIEMSPYHREVQKEALENHPVTKKWYSSLEEAAGREQIEGVILSNEWLDAFPVHIAEKKKTGWEEVWVTEQEDQFIEECREVTPELGRYLEALEMRLAAGMRIEVNLELEKAAGHVSRLLKKGFVVTIDYGDLQEDLYHQSRKQGTLMCYYRHQAHDNPYIHIGKQDITAHVNFSDWSKHGEKAGLREWAYMRQDRFLMRNGLLEKAVSHMDTDPFRSPAMKRNRAIQQLIDPAGLGGRFRVMVQAKEVDESVVLRFR
ncbi:class I SAM-dependent methyltransferase [Brevibacillus reuszeri]|uniref:class I SAM-dependent methyltransferase n=1 Tax=Brevibacillus reuszeri TaxID=54915 RepID=UPI000CCC6386|nr:SAM-dependent methyltransferase [Brevibacillus reuszeri]